MKDDAALAVALVEDDRRFRGVLQMLMEGTPGFDLAFAAGSVEEALRIDPTRPPRVILLDIHLPGLSGIEGVGYIRERFPDAVVLMLTVFEDEDRIFEALCNGAGGYLLKKTPPARLLEYVSEAATGGAPMSPEIAAKVVRLFARLPKRVAVDEHLTTQENGVPQAPRRGPQLRLVGPRARRSASTPCATTSARSTTSSTSTQNPRPCPRPCGPA